MENIAGVQHFNLSKKKGRGVFLSEIADDLFWISNFYERKRYQGKLRKEDLRIRRAFDEVPMTELFEVAGKLFATPYRASPKILQFATHGFFGVWIENE